MIGSPRLAPLQRAFLRTYGWATHRLYNELAFVYDPVSVWVSGGRWEGWRGLALDYIVGHDVLEVGFGTGELLRALDGRGLFAVGVEPSTAMQRVAGRKLARLGISVPRVRAFAAALPFAGECFDTVVSTFPAEYILQAATLSEIARVIRPPGRLVIAGLSVELPRSWRRPLSLLPSSWGSLWAYFAGVAGEAGFSPQIVWRDDPPARVPVIICTKAAP